MRPRVVSRFTFRKAGPPNARITRSMTCWALGSMREGSSVGFCSARSPTPPAAVSKMASATAPAIISPALHLRLGIRRSFPPPKTKPLSFRAQRGIPPWIFVKERTRARFLAALGMTPLGPRRPLRGYVKTLLATQNAPTVHIQDFPCDERCHGRGQEKYRQGNFLRSSEATKRDGGKCFLILAPVVQHRCAHIRFHPTGSEAIH